jgi:hypothetical protein
LSKAGVLLFTNANRPKARMLRATPQLALSILDPDQSHCSLGVAAIVEDHQ